MNNTTVDINFHELCGKLRSMKLSSMADTLEKQLANPNSGLQSFDERISEIICSEWDTRYTKKFNRFLKKATLKYPAADIDESIYDADRFLDTTTIERLASCNWIDEGKNLLITGSTGSGKTYISNALCISALRLFHTVRYVKASTLTMPEMARQLGITRNQVYGILNSQKYQHLFEFVTIADRKRITKESFQKFLEGQDEYHLDPANDYEELAMEENVALANYRRKKLAQTGERGRNGNLQYLTIDEAAFMAKVSRSMINVWYTKGYFPVVKIRNHVRIKRKEFEAWLEKRNTERGC